MDFLPGLLYHIYNRGNNSNRIFFQYANYIFFLKKVRTHMLPFCDILSYSLMPTHFHFEVLTKETINGTDLNDSIGVMLRSYTRAINKQENRTGSLFQQKTKAKLLETACHNYPFICFNYIHQNAMVARLVNKMEDWEFSSFRDYIGHRNGTLCNKDLAYHLLDLPSTAEDLYKLSYQMINKDYLDGLF